MEEIPVQPVIKAPPPIEPQLVKKPFLSKTIIAVFIIVIIFILLPAGTYLFLNSNKQVACTTEAKLCPDGSSVGRTGPKCEFATCPKTPTANWKTYTNKTNGYYLKIPKNWRVDTENAKDSEYKLINIYSNDFQEDSDVQGPHMIKGVFLIIHSGIDVKSYDELIKETRQDNSVVPKSYDEKEILVDGEKTTIWISNNFYDPKFVDYQMNTFHNGQGYVIYMFSSQRQDELFKKILSTFKFTDQAPTPTCKPRPACLDATPRCMIPETSDMCPPSVTPSQ